jgi:dual oxidase
MLAGQHRPSPRVLSQLFMKGEEGLPSMYNRTALLAFFGKLNP